LLPSMIFPRPLKGGEACSARCLNTMDAGEGVA
jgi:hypothetical protein